MIVLCESCGKNFQRKGSHVARVKRNFCSVQCMSVGYLKYKSSVCDCCGKEILKAKGRIDRAKKHYCSIDCRRRSGNYEERVIVNCFKCGKEIKRYLDKVKRAREAYCSRECRKNSTMSSCQWCGKEFSAGKARRRNGRGIHCSKKCFVKNFSTNKKYRETNRYDPGKRYEYSNEILKNKWELAVAKWLDSQGFIWEYETKTFLLSNGSHYTPDFFLPTTGEFIEVKGRHSLLKTQLLADSGERVYVIDKRHKPGNVKHNISLNVLLNSQSIEVLNESCGNKN